MGRNTGGERGEGPNGPGAGNPSGGGFGGSKGGGNSSSGNASGGGGLSSSQSSSMGRRDTASKEFGGLNESSELGLSGLTEAATVGIGAKDRGMSELGEIGWSGPGNERREAAADMGQKRGAQMAVDASGLQSVSNLAGGYFGLGVKGLTEAAERGMTAEESRGFTDVQGKKTGLSGLAGLLAGITLGPTAGAMATLGITALDHARQAQYAQERYGINESQSRRDDATTSFSGNSGFANKSSVNLTTSPPKYWEPSSIGFGEYDSHIKGLLA
ncbi:MAG: hypothetical protein LPD71_00190 [Shewanella sp.]|nr:hypothetical protein [Shewanella sp.]MCF1457209.1 hypothetical protein [Shewanella sp.]